MYLENCELSTGLLSVTAVTDDYDKSVMTFSIKKSIQSLFLTWGKVNKIASSGVTYAVDDIVAYDATSVYFISDDTDGTGVSTGNLVESYIIPVTAIKFKFNPPPPTEES